MIKRYQKLLVLLVLLGTWVQITNAQDVRRPGTLDIQIVDISTDIDGRPITPALQENEGLIRIRVARNQIFSIHNVARWIRDNDMQFIARGGFNVDVSRVTVRDDETIILRFENPFLGNQTTAMRHFQIRHPEGFFNNYYQQQQIHKQQVTTYEISVLEEPVFDREAVPTGNLRLLLNEDGATVQLINNLGQRVDERIAVIPAADSDAFELVFDNLPIGNYIVIANREGFNPVRLANIPVSLNAETTREINFERQQQLRTSEGRLVVQTNVDDVQLRLGFQDGTVEERTIFDGFMVADLRPGRYRLTMHPEGFDPYAETVEVVAGREITREITMRRSGPMEVFQVNSYPANAEVLINGRNVGRTPYTARNFSRDQFVIEVRAQFHKSFIDTLQFFTERSEALEISLDPHYLAVTTTPAAQVTMENRNVGQSPVRIDKPENKIHNIGIYLPNYLRVDTLVDLRNRDYANIEIDLVRGQTDFSMIPSVHRVPATIELSSSDFNQTFSDVSLLDLSIPYNRYNVRVTRRGFRSIEQEINVQDPSFTFAYNLEPKSKFGSILMSAVLPGTGQMYWGKRGFGRLLFWGFLGAAGYTAYLGLEYDDHYNLYQIAYDNYWLNVNTSSDQANAERRSLMMQRHEVMLDAQDELQMMLYVTAGIYGINMLERIISPSAKRIIRRSQRSRGDAFEMQAGPAGMNFQYRF